ncbi:5-oxoprolinase subunit PxpB [Rubrivivax gelatinosus]|uniref:Carboxyltransferase domain-containing protein n=1 Tax=Rubrivivax gelatinosus TaxID=28068 RepID=A0ABS1DUK9_RUBGE|nr:hypothetical protein [Rubrivivax gelatinosus]
MTDLRIEPLGDSALILRLGHEVGAETTRRVRAAARQLERDAPAGVHEVVPAYTSVTVHYRPERVPGEAGDLRPPYERLRERLQQSLARLRLPRAGAAREVVVPVWYGGAAGPDLEAVAAACGLDAAEVVRRHLASAHEVCMLGFAPGFPFITGLDPALRMPRRATPRTRIAPGSVAIAREQTCIYPLETPGGWQLLGRTPLRLFDPQAAAPSLLRPGDRIRFEAIDEARFHDLQAAQRR